ncbi:MAG TPA: class I SAM-dependent methyltransferase, partial [Nannocystaceae bacterium]|nr:class I SAM-dependent methyltransferase [Nannocystaceae bacterium]
PAVYLDARLAAIASCVPPSCRVADIGTDHGRLAAALLARDADTQVIATDRASAPLARAAKTLARSDAGRFELRLGAGLSVLRPGEVDTVVLAGMGGTTICRLLDDAGEIVRTLARIVVQPQGHWADVRRWIAERRATLVDELLVEDGGRFRLVCALEPGGRDSSSWSELDLSFGPRLRVAAGPVWRAWLRGQACALDRALADAIEGGARIADTARVRARRDAIARELARADPLAAAASARRGGATL